MNEYKALFKYLSNFTNDINKLSVKAKENEFKYKELESDINEYTIIKSLYKNLNNNYNYKIKKYIDVLYNYNYDFITVDELFDCLRKAYFMRKKYKINEINMNHDKLFFIRKNIYKIIKSYMLEQFDFHEKNKKVYSKKFNILGVSDAVHNKTDMFKITSELFDISFKDEKFVQMAIESQILNNEYGYNISKLNLIIVKNDDIKVISQKISKFDVKKYFKLAQYFMTLIFKNKIPERIENRSICNNCFYNNICFSQINKNIETSKRNNYAFLM